VDRYTLPKRYHVVKKLGVGSTGSVYLVFDNLLKKEVALKIFDGSKPYQPNEFKLLSRLEHPNIVKVFDYFCGKEGEYTFFTQEYVEGLDIVSYSKNLNQEDKLHLVSELAIGISFLHDNNIIHQDLKPSNIFVTKKEGVKILDFGMAGLVEKDGLSGTPAYMAPELIEGSIPDQRSDLYALGVIIHEMIVGSNPFIGKNIADTLHRQKAFSPKIDGDKRISPVIAILLKKLLSKEPNLRLQGAEEVLYFLQRPEQNSFKASYLKVKT
jgi:serine/threonine-protein kinase